MFNLVSKVLPYQSNEKGEWKEGEGEEERGEEEGEEERMGRRRERRRRMEKKTTMATDVRFKKEVTKLSFANDRNKLLEPLR